MIDIIFKSILIITVIGVFCASGTLFHSIALGLDIFVQTIIWNDSASITISARAGLAQRNGKPLGAKIVNFIMFNKNHCEEAIAWDIARANKSLKILTGE